MSNSTESMAASLLGLVALAGAAAAAPSDWGGKITVGAREVQVDGDRAKYDQHLNLEGGLRLKELVLHATSTGRGPDRIDIALYDLGGDPNERMEVRIQDYGRYRFEYRRQRSEYVYEDILVLPENASATQSTGGDFHRLDFHRISDQVKFDLHLTDRAALNVAYARYRKTGDSTTVLDVQREEFELEQPVDETFQLTSLGLSYRWDALTVLLTERYRRHDNDIAILLPGFSVGSEPDAPSALDTFLLEQPFSYASHEHVVQIRAHPGEGTQLDLQVMRATLDGDYRARERSTGTDFTGAPFAQTVDGGGSLTRDTDLVDLHGRFALTDRVSLVGGVRRYALDQEGSVDFDPEVTTRDWDVRTTAFEVAVEAALSPAVFATAGWISERRRQAFTQGTGQDVDEDSDHDGYFADLSWRPGHALNVSLSAENSRIDDPLSPSAATDRQRYGVRARYRLGEAWTLLASHRRSRHENDNSGWESRDKHTELRISYATQALLVTLGAARVDGDREISPLVRTPLRSFTFDIDYASEASFYDGSMTWRVSDALSLGGSVRRYRNQGSFDVSRDDARVHVELGIAPAYRLGLEYRSVDFREGGIEHYTADIIELSLRRSF